LALVLFALTFVAGRVLHAPTLGGILLVAAGVCALIGLGGGLSDRDYRDPGPGG
jgi:hypothetical protein